MKRTIFITMYLLAGFLLSGLMLISTFGASGDLDQFGNRFALFSYLNDAQLSFTVSRSDDRDNAVCEPGDCSLREAVNAANASQADDTINFAAGLRNIALTNEIVINNARALTINGPGANILAIGGSRGNRIFSTNQATVTISGTTLTGGFILNGLGGAILATGGSVTLDSVFVRSNYAQGAGGGVFFEGGTHRITNSTFSANRGGAGGGIGNHGDTLTIVNSTISGNEAAFGGGISADVSDITLRNVTITDNTANTWGGGFFGNDDDGSLSFGNTIIAGNNCIIGPEILFSDDFIFAVHSEGGNLVGDSLGDSAHTGGTVAYRPSDIRDTIPQLGRLQNNGGPTLTHALLAGSPAIDRGLNPLVNPLANVFDQRGTGFARVRDGNSDGTATVDIGAFEFQSGASFAIISGRVLTPDGRGLRNATVSITDSNGVRRIVTTSSFGFFSFDSVATGGTFVVSVSSRLYRFNSQTVQVDGNLTLTDFVGLE